MNPSWHVQVAKTKLSSPKPSAVKQSHRKRTGNRIRDKGRLALAPCLRRSQAAEHRRVGIRAKNYAYCTRKRIITSQDHTVVDENHCYESVSKYHHSIHNNQFTISQTHKAQNPSLSKRRLEACECVRFLNFSQINSANICLDYKKLVLSPLQG